MSKIPTIIEAMQAEKTQLIQYIQYLKFEQTKLRNEIAQLKREAECIKK